jgi:hypothetical protein
MKHLKYAIVMLGLMLAGKAAAQSNGNTVGLFKTYSTDMPGSLKLRLDSIITATAERFNSDNHSLEVALNDSSATQKVTLDFSKGKLATKKQRYVAYLVNLIVPVYIPAHKVKSSMTFPGNMNESTTVRSVKSSTHILVGSIEKREEKMLRKYADRLLRELVDMENRLRPEYISSIR